MPKRMRRVLRILKRAFLPTRKCLKCGNTFSPVYRPIPLGYKKGDPEATRCYRCGSRETTRIVKTIKLKKRG